jgi:hypothetical protein
MNHYNLVFQSQVKSLLGVDEGYSNPAFTSKLDLAIRSSTLMIEKLLGRNLSKNTYTEYHSSKRNISLSYDLFGSGYSGYASAPKPFVLYLKNFPVDSQASIQVYFDPNAVFDSSVSALDSSLYDVDFDTGAIYFKTTLCDAQRALKVVYTAGYESTVDTAAGEVYDAQSDPPQEQALANTLPDDLVQAALYQVMHVFEKSDGSNVNQRESRSEGKTNASRYINIGGIAPEAMAIVVQYRRPRIAMV